MTKNNIKTILFASLTAILVLSLGGNMQSVEAAKQPYTLAEIDRAFTNSEGYVSYDEDGNMVVDKKQMHQDNVSRADIKIMNQWAKLSNDIANAVKTGNQTDIDRVVEKAQSGRFSLLTSDAAYDSEGSVSGQTDVDYYSLTACGITYGQTSHPPPVTHTGRSGFESRADIHDDLVAEGYSKVYLGTALNYGDDYSKPNLVGVGGCDEGEFRDQEIIRKDPGGLEWYTTQHLNEPNSEILEYLPPTYWWHTYVLLWHFYN